MDAMSPFNLQERLELYRREAMERIKEKLSPYLSGEDLVEAVDAILGPVDRYAGAVHDAYERQRIREAREVRDSDENGN